MSGPWDPSKDVHSALTRPRFTSIADLLWAVQAKVARHVQPHEGDDQWVAGCTGYRRRCVALEKMAKGSAKEWLWAGLVDGQFTIRIQGFPVRVYRAAWEGGVPTRYATGSDMEKELLGQALAFPVDQVPGVLYRVEVAAGKFGNPVRVSFVEVDEHGQVARSLIIPRSARSATTLDDINIKPIRRRKPPIIPPVPDVGSKAEEERKKNPNDNREEDTA